MGDYNAPRPGYTRTGKTLKQVRRYYAMQDSQRRRKRSPDADDDDGGTRTATKRKRSPDDDKLSKRIFQELRVQQEANEKRSRRLATPPEHAPMPVLEMREVGPVFVTKNEAVNPVKSIKSAGKSAKSTPAVFVQDSQSSIHSTNPTGTGCIISCFFLALVYAATWMYMIVEPPPTKGSSTKPPSDFGQIRWLALTSTLAVGTVPYWLLASNEMMHAIVSVMLMFVSLISVSVYLMYQNIITDHAAKPSKYYLSDAPNPLNFWFPVTFLILHILSISFMIRHVIAIRGFSRPAEAKSGESKGETPQMSVFLTPK